MLPVTVLLSAAAIVSICFYKYFLYPVFLSPLSQIPNAHFTASFSSLWILRVRSKSTENHTLLSCHQKYGPVIRVSPNEISINCVDNGIRTVYAGGFEKTDWYPKSFGNYDIPNMFSTAESKPHSIRKRMISNIYSKSYLQTSEDMQSISQTILSQRLLPSLDSFAQSQIPIDVLEWNFAIFMDFVTAYLFGLGNGSNFLLDIEYRRHWLSIYNDRNENNFGPQELWKSILYLFGLKIVPDKVAAANKEIEEFTLKMCQAADATITTDHKTDTSTLKTSPVVYQQLFQGLERADLDPWSKYPKDLTVASEMLDHLAAGHETSAITLTYLMHELSKRPELQDALRAELLTLTPPITYPLSRTGDLMQIPNPRSTDSLPLLQAILLETLRRHAAIPGPQPRITPYNQPTPIKLGQYSNIPGGVRVSALAYTLHRNPAVFPNPEEWKPERWLHASKEQRTEMDRWFWAFGSGGRMCIGKNLALQQLNLVIAAIYTNFRTKIIDDSGIEQEDTYTARPTGNKLVLKFERAQ